MLSREDYEIVKVDPIRQQLVFKRAIKPGERIDFSDQPYSVRVQGDIGEGAIVNCKYNLDIDGDISSHCVITSQAGYIAANNVGMMTKLTAGGVRIKVANVGNGSILESKSSINAGNIGSQCTLIAEDGEITTGNIGTNTKMNALHHVRALDIDESVKIISKKSSVRVGNIARNVEISALTNIQFISVIDAKLLASEKGELQVQLDKNGFAFGTYQLQDESLEEDGQLVFETSNVSTVSVEKGAKVEKLSISIGSYSFKNAAPSKSPSTIFVKDHQDHKNKAILENDEHGTHVSIVNSSPK